MITSSVVDKLDAYQFYNRTEQKAHAYLEFKHTVYKDGSCGDLQIPPLKRLCTPYLHVHPHQKESFTLLQGQLGYQLGDRINSCDIRTCPSPIVVQPLVVHSFWMTDDREDLILTVRIEPTYEDHGLSASAFENIVGVRRDNLMSLWQALLFIDYIETYPVSLPLSWTKWIVRCGSWIGYLLGYQMKYDEYTTRVLTRD